MDGTIVFILLLDHLSENILNKTLETIEVTHTEYSSTYTCDYAITDPLLQIISRELEMLVVPKWLTAEKRNSSKNYTEHPKTVLDANTRLGAPMQADEASDKMRELYKSEDLVKSYELSRQAPIMAAIFESLSNITAQTCAGTVIAPRWVLTDAKCVGLLSDLNAQSTSIKEKSEYTTIINAMNPLTDGTAYNVTEILLHPDAKNQIALLHIEPALVVKDVPLVGKPDYGEHVTVYGWTTKVDDSEQDMMALAALRATILSHEDCIRKFNYSLDASGLCLVPAEYETVDGQMSWGGPVVTSTGGILAVTRLESQQVSPAAPIAAWPLADHLTWIRDAIQRSVQSTTEAEVPKIAHDKNNLYFIINDTTTTKTQNIL